MFDVPINNFSVMSRWSHYAMGFNHVMVWGRVNVPCSWTQLGPVGFKPSPSQSSLCVYAGLELTHLLPI